MARTSTASKDELDELHHIDLSINPCHPSPIGPSVMHDRRVYAWMASDIHEQRTDCRLKVTDKAILSEVFLEEEVESVDPYLAVRKRASAKGKESEQTLTLSIAGIDPSTSEAAPVSLAPPPASVASSTIASVSEIKLPEAKAGDTMAWLNELAETALTSTADRKSVV